MLQFVGTQYDEFIKIAEFLLRLTGEKIKSRKRDYHDQIGDLTGMGGGVKNSLFSPDHTISRHGLELFQSTFNRLTKNKESEHQATIKVYKDKLSVLKETLLAQGDFDPNDLNAARKANEKSQQDKGTGSAKLPPFMQDSFVHSTWHCYENEDGSILQSVMEFKASNELTIDVSIQKNDTGSVVHSLASFIYEDNILIIKPVGKNNGNYTHYTILLDGIVTYNELCFGHLTSRQNKPYTLTTKTIILQRDNDNFKKGNVKKPYDKKEKSLLSDYLQNSTTILTSPSNFDLQNPAFFQRQKEHQEVTPSSYIHQPLLGHYAVFYKLELHDEELTENHVEIFRLENKLKVRYTHNLTPDEPITWEGEGYINFHSHTLTTQLLEMYNGSYSLATSRPTFLLIAIPEIAITKIEVLPGLVTGSRDHNLGSASRLVLLVKLDNKKLPEGFSLDVIKNFFTYYKKSCWIDIPRTKQIPALYRFSDLINIVKQYKEEFGTEFPNFDL